MSSLAFQMQRFLPKGIPRPGIIANIRCRTLKSSEDVQDSTRLQIFENLRSVLSCIKIFWFRLRNRKSLDLLIIDKFKHAASLMSSTKDVSVFQSRKSDIFSPSLKESGQLPGDSKSPGLTNRSPDQKKDSKKRRDLSAANEFDQLHSPLIPGKTQRDPQTQNVDLTSSINSSTRTLITKKHRFHISKIAIIITMLLQMITFGVQLYFFGMFIAYVNNEHDCLLEHIFGWVMVVFAVLGLLLGFWGILSVGVQRFSRYTRRTIIIRTSIVVLYLITIIVLVAIFQYDTPLPRCIDDKSKVGLLPYVLIWIIPTATLILAVIGALLSWKLIRDAKKINDLERTEQEKDELFSKVAKDLEEP